MLHLLTLLRCDHSCHFDSFLSATAHTSQAQYTTSITAVKLTATQQPSLQQPTGKLSVMRSKIQPLPVFTSFMVEQ